MNKIIKTGLLFLVFSFLVGCGGIAFKKPKEPNQSMIIGAIDMSDASGKFNNVVMKQIQPVTDKPFHHFIVKDGQFFRSSIPYGIYKMHNFQSYNSWTSTYYTYNFPTSGRGEMDLKINKPGIYYVGSWKYKKVSVGFKKWFMGKGEFDLERVQSPSELEILNNIKAYSKDEYWTNLINKRISELEKSARNNSK